MRGKGIGVKGQASTWQEMKRHKSIYWMIFPVAAYYLIFHYSTFYYAVIAFLNYKPKKGLSGSEFIGFQNFVDFLTGNYAWRVIRNTLVLNLYEILFAFTAAIVFALMIHQMTDGKYKRIVQTVTYMPHFISVVVVCGLLVEFCQSDGIINEIFGLFGFERRNLLSDPKYFRTIYVSSDIWQNMGWGTIIYLATLTGVDQSLHEAAAIDGAGRIRRIIHINIPSILPVIVVQLIMRVGHMMTMGYEKVILLYSPATYETADIISSYVYRKGLYDRNYSYGAAVGLFNSVINLIILYFANTLSRKVTENSLW